MRLILTDFISSLKEDRELDELVQELLREYEIEIVSPPQRGRQYGVDVYAVGPDWKDGGTRKVFLLTVKRGNLDRQNWQGSVNALQPSLEEMCSVFIRNNLHPEHNGLPVKVIVVHNGINEPSIEQNFRAFADKYPHIDFNIWQLETLVNLVEEKLLNEYLFSGSSRVALRKILVNCYSPGYDFADYKVLLDDLFEDIDPSDVTRGGLKNLRMINLVVMIIVSWCEKEGDLRLAYKVTEITMLRYWKFLTAYQKQLKEEHWSELMKLTVLRKNALVSYLDKISSVCQVQDGFSRYCHDPVTYTFVVYEHMGMIAMAGLEFLQLRDIYNKDEKYSETASIFYDEAVNCTGMIIHLINNNNIIYHPRADDHIIEWNLVFLLLYRMDKKQDIRTMMIELNNRLAHAMIFSKLAPHFTNNVEEIYELDINPKKREGYEYKSTSLLACLMEWTAALEDEALFDAYRQLKNEVFKDFDLLLWLPDEHTEDLMFTKKALPSSGYSLSIPEIPEQFDDFKTSVLLDYIYNSCEPRFSFIDGGFWSVGLMASRHYRTYVFPFYWRMLIKNCSEWKGQQHDAVTTSTQNH